MHFIQQQMMDLSTHMSIYFKALAFICLALQGNEVKRTAVEGLEGEGNDIS
jgi:hypothetical protein